MKSFDCLEMNKGLKKNCKAKRETKRIVKKEITEEERASEKLIIKQ